MYPYINLLQTKVTCRGIKLIIKRAVKLSLALIIRDVFLFVFWRHKKIFVGVYLFYTSKKPYIGENIWVCKSLTFITAKIYSDHALEYKNFFFAKSKKKKKKKRFCNLKCNVWGHLTGRECTYDIWFQQLQRDNINVIKRCSGWLMQFLLFSAKYIILAHIVRKLYIPMLFICCWQSLFVFSMGKSFSLLSMHEIPTLVSFALWSL